MPIRIAEYLGSRIDRRVKIERASKDTPHLCPFMNGNCSKIKQGYKPVCSVRTTDNTIWIVCRNRLCATKKDVPLSEHQVGILAQVAKAIFRPNIELDEILVRREVPIPLEDGASSYLADFIMIAKGLPLDHPGPSRVVLEMQGGGETSNTGKLSRHVAAWETGKNRDAEALAQAIDGVGPIVTNAWRRQQQQFLIKGNVAVQTGGGIVFCVGTLLFDELNRAVKNAGLRDLEGHAWNLAVLGFCEQHVPTTETGSISFVIDDDRKLFTNFHTFVRALADQGKANKEIFLGSFESLDGRLEEIK